MTDSTIINKEIKPVIDYLIDTQWRLENKDAMSYDKIRHELKEGILLMEQKLKKYPNLSDIIHIIKYAIVVLCDEILNFTKWEGQKKWQNALLEKEMCNSVDAGNLFFKYMDNEALRHPLLAEIFYICFVLAFQKRLKNEHLSINRYKEKLYHAAQLTHIIPDNDRFLSPGANQTINIPIKNLPPLFGTTSLIIFIVMLIGAYLIASQFLWHDVIRLILDISNYITTKGY
ncbi:Type IV / VI secretion system, DotU domain protein [Candidatus Magnetomorum sp. HK-1]|nr:Type IV / VI secretion system, DotU domain protein [Candidatus Magnetomorum sp. HK-1]